MSENCRRSLSSAAASGSQRWSVLCWWLGHRVLHQINNANPFLDGQVSTRCIGSEARHSTLSNQAARQRQGRALHHLTAVELFAENADVGVRVELLEAGLCHCVVCCVGFGVIKGRFSPSFHIPSAIASSVRGGGAATAAVTGGLTDPSGPAAGDIHLGRNKSASRLGRLPLLGKWDLMECGTERREDVPLFAGKRRRVLPALHCLGQARPADTQFGGWMR